MTKEKIKQCADCIKQIKLAKKFGKLNDQLKKFMLNEYDVTEAEIQEYENMFK